MLSELLAGEVSAATRGRLAVKGFAHTAAYDAAISTYLGETLGGASRALRQFEERDRPIAVQEGRRVGRLLCDGGDECPDIGCGLGEWHAGGD